MQIFASERILRRWKMPELIAGGMRYRTDKTLQSGESKSNDFKHVNLYQKPLINFDGFGCIKVALLPLHSCCIFHPRLVEKINHTWQRYECFHRSAKDESKSPYPYILSPLNDTTPPQTDKYILLVFVMVILICFTIGISESSWWMKNIFYYLLED